MPTWIRSRTFLPALFALTFVAAPALAVTPNGRLQIIHMDVGQGDGTLLISPLGECVLIDDGLFNATSRPVNELAALGVTHVRYHFASHYHADHIGAISQIQNSGVTIDYGWDRSGVYAPGSATFNTYVSALGSRRMTLTKGQVFQLDSLSAHPVYIRVIDLAGAGLHPTDENSLSVELRVSYGEYDESFGGDLTGTTLSGGIADVESVVGPEQGPVEVYKVHHHGSGTSSNYNYLAQIAPKIAVIQVGNGNTFGHPTATTVARLHAFGIHTYWNELGGQANSPPDSRAAIPDPAWDKVARVSPTVPDGRITIEATWEPGGVDTIRGNGFADTFTNSGTAVDVTAPVVNVTSPNGGENLVAGAATNLTWTATDNVGVSSVDLDYSLDNGTNWTTITTGIANSGTYGWTLPDANSALARVRATARDAAGNFASDPSNAAFTIADHTAPVAVTISPNGGESFDGGTTQLVRWTASDNVQVDSVSVQYSLHGAAGPWTLLAHGITAADSVDWVVPDSTTDSALVRVTAYDEALNQGSDPSDNLFHLVGSSPSGVGGGVTLLSFSAPQPNPSQDAVSLDFSLPGVADARIDVLDVSGRRVWSWAQASLSPGAHRVAWDGRLASGSRAGVGLYWARLSGTFGVRTVKLVRIN